METFKSTFTFYSSVPFIIHNKHRMILYYFIKNLNILGYCISWLLLLIFIRIVMKVAIIPLDSILSSGLEWWPRWLSRRMLHSLLEVQHSLPRPTLSHTFSETNTASCGAIHGILFFQVTSEKAFAIAIEMPVKLLLRYSKTALTLTLRLSSKRGQNWFIFSASWKPIFYLFTFPLTIMFQITIHKWNNFSKLLSSFYTTFQCKTTSAQYVAGVTDQVYLEMRRNTGT